jgi:hypothetical protein
VVVVADVVRGVIANEDQLDAALGQLQEHCLKNINDGTPVIFA